MSLIARLTIVRGAAGEAPRTESFDVPYQPGQSILDGLRWIRAQRDPTLAMRYSCLSANACKECMMLLDGRVIYACTTRLEARPMHLAPLANKALLRDLVTVLAPPDERLGQAAD